jgi:GNAT superfamily N-acetyltransferase
VANGWTTRSETPNDVKAIREVNLAAFPTAAEADLVDALRASDAWIEGLSIVTEDNEGPVVGHALLTRCHVGGAPALALAPCAVLPSVQRRGAGSAAIRAALATARTISRIDAARQRRFRSRACKRTPDHVTCSHSAWLSHTTLPDAAGAAGGFARRASAHSPAATVAPTVAAPGWLPARRRP